MEKMRKSFPCHGKIHGIFSIPWKNRGTLFHSVENPMMIRPCPLCRVPLEPEDYEGFRVLRCPQCQGHLVELSRFRAIQSLPRKTLAELEAEARAGFQGDTAAPVPCPRCYVTMQKRPLNVPGFDLHLDLCRGCSLAWFDGGELAMAQLGHQATPGFQDRQDHQQRAGALEADPGRKAAFDEALSKMPLEKDAFSQGLKESVVDALRHILFRIPIRFPFR
jgi:Zn-finger nucleic acid-binding protein